MGSARIQREQIKSNSDSEKSKKSNNAGFRRPVTLRDERPRLTTRPKRAAPEAERQQSTSKRVRISGKLYQPCPRTVRA